MTLKNTTVSASDTEVLKNKIQMLIGKGVGDIGYGQSNSIFKNIHNTKITPISWNDYKTYLSIASDHQTGGVADTSSTRFPIPVGGDIQIIGAEDIDTYDTEVEQLLTDRLSYDTSSMTLYNNVFASMKAHWWGPRQTITSEIDLLWANEDKARYFFNSGGDIRMVPSQPNWSYLTRSYYNWGVHYSWQYRSGGYWWNFGLPSIGTVKFDAHSTSSNGSAGTPSLNIGFYELTNNYQYILDATDYYNPYTNIPGYTDIDDFYIEAKKITNGIRFRVRFVEQNQDQQVDPGTRIDFSLLKATTYLTNPPIDTPQFIIRTAF